MTDRRLSWQTAASLAGLALAAYVAYWPALTGSFIWDDDVLLTGNPLVKSADGLFRMWFTTQAVDYWPMTGTSFWFEWRLWGVNAAGYHATNLLLHVIGAWLLWMILRRLAVAGALLAAWLFALHPVNVESVAWISERKNTLSLVFFLLSMLWYLKFDEPDSGRFSTLTAAEPDRSRSALRRRPNAAASNRTGRPAARSPQPASRTWYWLSLAAFVLAMLSKGSVATLPAMLLLIAWWKRGTIARSDLWRTAPFFAVAGGLTLVNIWFQTRHMTEAIRDATPVQRLLGAASAIWFYLYKALLPLKLIFVYPLWQIRADDPRWWAPLAAAIATTLFLVWQRQRPIVRSLLVAWIFFCLALVPVMGFADVYFMRYSLVADHYEYIALLAVVAATAAAIDRAAPRKPVVARAIGGAVIILLGTATWRQSHQYADAETIYRSTIAANPSAWMAHNNLGLFLLRGSARDFQEGLNHLETALAGKPTDPTFHNNVGVALFQMGRYQEALDHHREAVRLAPSYADAYNNLAADSQKLGRYADAVAAYRKALTLNPSLPLHSSLAAALEGMGRGDEAARELQASLGGQTRTEQEHGGAGDALLRLGRTDEAIAQYQDALRQSPQSAEIMNNLGYAFMTAGRLDEAERYLRQAARIRPGDAAIHDNLGNVLQQTQRLDEAISEFNLALTSGSGVDLGDIHNDLGVALAKQGRRDEAIVHFREAVRLKPNLAAARTNLAKALGEK